MSKKTPAYQAKKKGKTSQQAVQQKSPVAKKNKIAHFFIKLTLITIVLAILIMYADKKGYFNPDMQHDHTIQKWDDFYDFAKKQNVDVLLLGNSHLYTGINPVNLSVTLGVNSFVLASPGTHLADSYWALREALKITEPKVVVIETYGINNFNPYKLESSNLSDQFKSFSARRNLSVKLLSTPYLFSPDNYFLAWSNTLRNHNFILNNVEQIEKNIDLAKKGQTSKPKTDKKLLLGRYVRFNTGIEDSIMNKYETEGAPVDGAKYTYSKHAREYVERIISLCEKKNIELIFLTLPMHEKHVSNYDIWRKNLSEIYAPYPVNWIDMQEENRYKAIGFSAASFENTFDENQHMTYSGSLLATYSLASYIRDTLNTDLPDRASDPKWHKIFYGQEGYFAHFSPKIDDPANIILAKDTIFRNIAFDEIALIDNEGKSKTLIAKLSKNKNDDSTFHRLPIRLLIRYIHEKQERMAVVDLNYDELHLPEKYYLYANNVQPIEITAVLDALRLEMQ